MDKIVCIGKNYVEHVKEMGGTGQERPVIFLKPPSVLRAYQDRLLELKLPVGAGAVHHECEIVVKVGPEGGISEVTLGLDLTLRDRQAEQKKKGQPWTTSKVFPGSAVVGPWVRVSSFSKFLDTEFTFKLDGVLKQKGKGNEMSLKPEACLGYINEFFPLLPGDLVYTGTPAGVGPILPGQRGELTWGPITVEVIWS